MLYQFLQKFLLVLSSILLSNGVMAHEFWIEPIAFELPVGEKIQAHLKVGERMGGDTYAYYPNNVERFDLIIDGEKAPLNARFAQSPAVDQVADREGLHVLAYQSTSSTLRYEKVEKFHRFLKNEGIEWVKQAHKQRGLPALDFTELYKRYAKSLIGVGVGQGKDQWMGMPFEWVVNTNPYAHKPLNEVEATLYYEGKPFADAFVVVFQRVDAESEVERQTFTTDRVGQLRVPIGKGGTFLVNAVHMIDPSKEAAGGNEKAEWMSLWASTTFHVNTSKKEQ